MRYFLLKGEMTIERNEKMTNYHETREEVLNSKKFGERERSRS